MAVLSKNKMKQVFTREYSKNELINLLEKYKYFAATVGGQNFDYEKVLLFFILYSQSNSADQETTRAMLLFNLLQE